MNRAAHQLRTRTNDGAPCQKHKVPAIRTYPRQRWQSRARAVIARETRRASTCDVNGPCQRPFAAVAFRLTPFPSRQWPHDARCVVARCPCARQFSYT